MHHTRFITSHKRKGSSSFSVWCETRHQDEGRNLKRPWHFGWERSTSRSLQRVSSYFELLRVSGGVPCFRTANCDLYWWHIFTRKGLNGEWILSIYLILPAALGTGVYSDSNRIEYQEQKKCFWRVERGRCVRLITFRHLWADGLNSMGSLTSHKPIGLHGLIRG
jgi:hypothetical protein